MNGLAGGVGNFSNSSIKSVYTNYELYTVHQLLLIVMQKLIDQFSYQSKEFCFLRTTNFDVIKRLMQFAMT